ncbi:hypothetical protein [Pseudomonas sp. 57B-090624]|uniref:hypothetical protein n=1 Tax=Pseudomonas sp. 57B-090624 TaxID=2213080 RepID=UPI0011B61E06|nr:hypothetical protein [Pseudomonas sp. 57B-090624]
MFTVKNYGVSFSTKKSDIALTNFFVSLVGADIDFPIRTDSARKIIIDQDEKYIYGTVITIKNQKKCHSGASRPYFRDFHLLLALSLTASARP